MEKTMSKFTASPASPDPRKWTNGKDKRNMNRKTETDKRKFIEYLKKTNRIY
jgi:hypothetical protein